MDFHSLKRKDLQVLCRKHQIPANLTNMEMAERLTALSVVDEQKPSTRGRRSCLKSADDIVSGNESDLEVRPAKKVKFSPDNETIEFEKSAVRYSQVNGGRRRKSAMSEDKGSSAEKVNEEVREPGVSGRGKLGGMKVGIKGGKSGKKVDTLKVSEVVSDRATRRARRRLLMAGTAVEDGGRKATKVEVIEDNGTTSDVTDGGGKQDGRPGRGKSSVENAPGIRGKKTAKTDCLEDNATVQNAANEDTKEVRRPKRGRHAEGTQVLSKTGMTATKVEASIDRELVDDGLNGKDKQVRRSSRGKSPERVQIESKVKKRAIKEDALEDNNGLADDGVIVEVKGVRRSGRGKSPEGVQAEGKAGKRTKKVEASKDNGLADDGVIEEVKGVRRSRRGKSPEGMQVESKAAKVGTKDKALKCKGIVIDGSNEGANEVNKSGKGKSSEGMQVESRAEKEVAKDEAVVDKGLVVTGLSGDAKEVRWSRRGKSAEKMQVESMAGNKVAKDEGLKDKDPVDDGLNGITKEVRRSRRGKAEEMQVGSKAGKNVMEDEALTDKGRIENKLSVDAKVVRSSGRKSPDGMHVESKAGKKVTKDEASKDKGFVDDGSNLDVKEVRRSRRGKSPEVNEGKRVTNNDSVKDIGLVDGLSGDARELRRISRRGKFTVGSNVSKAKLSAVGDAPSVNIQNEEHIVVKKPPLSKRGASNEKREQAGGVSKRSKKGKSVSSLRSGKEEDCEDASGSKEAGIEVACVQLEAGVRRSNRHAVEVDQIPLSEIATKIKDVQRGMSNNKIISELKEISEVDISKIVCVQECSPVVSKLRRSQRSTSKLELSVQSTAVVTDRNNKRETRKKGDAVSEFETSAAQEGISNKRSSKKNAPNTGKGEMLVPAPESEKSAEKEELRSMRTNTEVVDTSNVDIPADLVAQAASVEGPTRTNIEDEDTSNVDFPAYPVTQAVSVEGPSRTNIEGEDISNMDIPADLEVQPASAEGPARTNIIAEDISNVDIPLDLDTQAILEEDPMGTNTEVKEASNVGISADLDAQAALAKDPTRANIEIKDTSNVVIFADLDDQVASAGDPTRTPVAIEYLSTVGVEDISNVDICADVDAEAAAVEAQTDSVCDNGIDAQLGANLPEFESTISAKSNILVERQGQTLAGDERNEGNDSLATHVRTPLTAEEYCYNSNLECIGELDEQPEAVSESTNSEACSQQERNEGHDSQTTHTRTTLTAGKGCSDGNLELFIDESWMQNEAVLESRNSEAQPHEERAEGNDSQTKNIRTPSTAENDCADGNLELTDDLDIHHETGTESTNFEPHSQTTHIRAPLTAGKDCSDGNLELFIDESRMQNEAVLESRNSEAHPHEERAEGNDCQTKNIRTPSTAENDSEDSNLELTDDLDKHHETAIGSTNSEAHSHVERNEGRDSQTEHIKTAPTEGKDSGDGNVELLVDYLDKQNESVVDSTNSEAHSNEERYEGNDSQTTHIKLPFTAEKVCVKQREVSPIKMNNCGAHYSSAMLTNFHNPQMSSFEDPTTDEIESSTMAAENSDKLLEHKSPDAIGRSASKILLDRDANCRVDVFHSSGMQGDMLYFTESSAEGVETEAKFSGSVYYDTKSMESAQTSPSSELNGKVAGEASKAVDMETHLVMSLQSPSELNRGIQPKLDQDVHAAKLSEHEDFGQLKPQESDIGYPLESCEHNSSYYKSSTDARTNICCTHDQVEEHIAACDQRVALSPGCEGTQIVDGGEGFGVCSGAETKEGSVSVEGVLMTNIPLSGGDTEIAKGTVSMHRSLDVEVNALDDQPAFRVDGESSCQEGSNEGKDTKTTHVRTSLTAEKDPMECRLYHVNNELDTQDAAVGESTSSEAQSTSPCKVNNEVVLQNFERKEKKQPNLEALEYSEPENSKIFIDTCDVGISYNTSDGHAKVMQTTLNANESNQDEDSTMLEQPGEVLPVQTNSIGLSVELKNYEHLEMDSLEDPKPNIYDSSKIVHKNSPDAVGRSTSRIQLHGDADSDENINYPPDMQEQVFNELSAKRAETASGFGAIVDDSGTESLRNSYSFDWDGFEAGFNAEVHDFSFVSNIPPEDSEEDYRFPLDHARVLEEEKGTSLFETQVNEHQLNKNETVSETQAPDNSEASVSKHYSMFSASEVADLLSDNQNHTSQPEELDQGLLGSAAESILELEVHQCTAKADEALDHNLVSNFKSDFTIGNTLGGLASESISSAAKDTEKSKNARSILIHGTPKRLQSTAHAKETESVSKVDKVGSLASVRNARPPSARKPWK